MVKIEFLGPINMESMSIQASNLEEVAIELAKYPELALWLEKSAVAVNDEIIVTKNFQLKNGDKISILPPVCGG